MSWSVVTPPNSDWGRTVDGTVWDDGATAWDVDVNVPTTFWDVTQGTDWTAAPAAEGNWSIVT